MSGSRAAYRPLDYLLIALVFGLLGAFFWAIRGTGGFGGAAGGGLAGLGWAMLWHGFSRYGGASRERPYGTGHAIAAIALGIAFGGLTGYGVYTAWVRGEFYLDYPDGMRSVAPWTGYAMLFVCGLHWGGIPGAFLAWCAPRRPVGRQGWIARISAGVAGAVLAGVIVRMFPQWFLPFYDEGIYAVEANATCQRAAGSIRNIAPHVGLYLGFLAYEIFRRDGRAVGMMLLMGFGFAIPFAVGGHWHTFRGSGMDMPWWKFWEMSIGFGGGLAFGLAFYLFNRPQNNTAPRPVTPGERRWATALILWIATGNVVASAYEGFVRHQELTAPGWLRIAVTVAWLGVLGAILLYWLRTPGTASADATAHEKGLLPGWAMPATILFIVVAGYLVSVPTELAWKHRVLLVLYTIYLVLTLGFTGLLILRRRPASAAGR